MGKREIVSAILAGAGTALLCAAAIYGAARLAAWLIHG